MKIVKLVFGILGAFWTIGVFVEFAPKLLSMDFSTRGIAELASGFAAVAICGVITLWLFQSALKKDVHQPSKPEDDGTSQKIAGSPEGEEEGARVVSDEDRPSSNDGARMTELVGKRIVEVHQGDWEAQPGVDMPGLAGPTWYYCDVFLTLDDSTVLKVTPGDISMQSEMPKNAERMDLSEEPDGDCLGCPVVDILEDEEPTVRVVLGDGRYLCHSYEPGGSAIFIRSFSDWDEDEVEPESTFTSFITKSKVSIQSLKKGADQPSES